MKRRAATVEMERAMVVRAARIYSDLRCRGLSRTFTSAQPSAAWRPPCKRGAVLIGPVPQHVAYILRTVLVPERRPALDSFEPQHQPAIMVPPPAVSSVSASRVSFSDVSSCRHPRRTAS